MIAPWIQECRRPVADVARALGWPLDVRKGMVCPACKVERRDRHRGAAGLTRDGQGWACHLCGAEGDGLDLAAYIGHGKRLRDLDGPQRRQLREQLTELQLTTGRWSAAQVAQRPMLPLPPSPPAQDDGPSAAEVEALWRRCPAVVADAQARAFCAARGLNAELLLFGDLARATPGPGDITWPAFWPRWRAPYWRLVSRMWSASGELLGLHGRAIVTPPEWLPKKALAHRMRARGWLANPPALAWFAGTTRQKIVAVAEGLTDWLALCCWARAKGGVWAALPILGGVAGSFQGAAELPPVETVLVATHTDKAGDKYADEVNRALGHRCDVRRVRLNG